MDEPRRRRDPRNQRETLRRLTAGTALGAAALTTLLFVQTSLAQASPGALQDAIASVISAFFPGANLRPAGENPSPAPGATPIAVSGGS